MRLTLSTAVIFLLSALAWPQSDSAALDRVLSEMDSAAKTFRSAEATFSTDHYTKVVDETETQKGKMYFQRRGKDVEMAADIAEPDKQYAIYSNGKAQVYNPKIDQVNEYKAEKNRAQVEAFLLLGFGGGGHDLLASYDAKYIGSESVGGMNASKLELLPKSQQMRNNIARILMWIDPARGVSVQLQLFFPEGDYRLTKYSDIRINQKLPENAFKLKTTPKTTFVSPQG